MKEKNKIILVLVVSMVVVTFCTLLGFGILRLTYLGSPRDLPLIGTIASAGDVLLNPNMIEPTPITATTSSSYDGAIISRTECKDYFDIAYTNNGSLTATTYAYADDVYGNPDPSITTDKLVDKYYYSRPNDPFYMSRSVFLLGEDYPEYDSRFRGKNIMVFTMDNCRYEIDLDVLGIKRRTLLSNIYYDSLTKNLYFETAENVGVFYDSTITGTDNAKSSIKSYLYNVVSRTFTVKEIPFGDGILKSANADSYFYIVEQQGGINIKDKISYFVVRYESTSDGCGLSCMIDFSEFAKSDLKTINSKIGAYAFHYDTGKLEKIYSTSFYNPTDKSVFMGGELHLEYADEAGVAKPYFQEKREIKTSVKWCIKESSKEGLMVWRN